MVSQFISKGVERSKYASQRLQRVCREPRSTELKLGGKGGGGQVGGGRRGGRSVRR